MFKFVHAADIHLDSPLRGLSRYEGAPAERIRGATRGALRELVQTSINENAAFLIIAGDVFDGDWKDYNTGLFFAGQMTRLREHGVRVFLLSGNHDAASKITKALKMPDNVRHFSTRRAESIFLEDIGVVLHGQGFSSPDVTENLAAGYPYGEEGFYNIGVLHTAASGREGHEPYAPCSIEDMAAKGYNYWALGHVHRREIIHDSPFIVFPGNIQGRHIRETGPKGCYIVTVEDRETTYLEYRSLDLVRWSRINVDCSGAETGEDMIAAVRSVLEEAITDAEGRLLAVRLEIEGSCRAHEELNSDRERWFNQIRAEATDISAGEIWIEKIHLSTTLPPDMEGLATGDSTIRHLLKFTHEIESDPGQMAELAGELSALKSRLPAEIRHGEDALNLESPVRIREILEQARQILLPLLLAKRDEQ